MPIQEKPVEIEFTYKSKVLCETGKGPTWTVKFKPSDESMLDGSPTLTIFPSNPTEVFPVEFFTEVVDFLRSKNIIPSSSVNSDIPQLPKQPSTQVLPLSIQLPQVIKKNTKEGMEGPGMDISREDLSSNDEPFISLVKNNNNTENATEKKAENNVVVDKNEISAENIPNRPVIRSRVTDNDPLSAEKDAATIRGKSKISIKRKDEK